MNEALRHNFPDQYELNYNVKILPTKATSIEAHYQHWIKKHKNDYIEICAWYDSKDIPTDEILIKAALGGDEDVDVLYFSVKKDRYNQRNEFGYIVQEGDTEMTLKK